MIFSFDYYKNIRDPSFYLCNPDMRMLSSIVARNRSCELRFNDLSTLTFEAPKYISLQDGTKIVAPYYDKIQTFRLIYVERVGWFQITRVEESIGDDEYKNVTAESHQTTFKAIGFYKENRVYKFYDPRDTTDSTYDAADEGALPSIIGQLRKQLGIQLSLHNTPTYVPTTDYGQWTITYISPGLTYSQSSSSNVCRTFEDSAVCYAYDFMVNDVEDAFEVFFDFDFLHHAIKIMSVSEVTEKTNIYLSRENLVKELKIDEDATDIVTVLNCSGQDLDIRMVNPAGTNYIVDFSYYMDEVNHEWMSADLITKLKAWEALVDSLRPTYIEKVNLLRAAYQDSTELSSLVPYLSLKIQDLEVVRDKLIQGELEDEIISAETVELGETSLYSASRFYAKGFSSDEVFECYEDVPTLQDGKFSYSGNGRTDTLENNMKAGYLYFADPEDGNSYCKITQAAKLNDELTEEIIYVGGLERYTTAEQVNTWLALYNKKFASVKDLISGGDSSIQSITEDMAEIADQANILNYFSDSPELYNELRCYWIEGDYENEHLAVLENTTHEETIDLALELLENGEKELAKVCQPRFSLTVDSVNFMRIYEFRQFSEELALGKVITVEKEDGLFFYPALTSFSFSFDDPESFTLNFSNALKLNDWGFTYADLITSSASTSRTVSANWGSIMDYSNNKDVIQDLLRNPLDRTLRAAEENMTNQEFVIDTTGILGRKQVEEGVFDNEQIRLINNVILFTDDNWATAKTALGKVIFNDGGQAKSAYGLLAEVVVGELMMSSTLKIVNTTNTITLDEDGIRIKNASTGSDVFRVTDNGDAYFNGSGRFNGYVYATDGVFNGTVYADSGEFNGTVYATDGVFKGRIEADEGYFHGTIQANDGEIGGLIISDGGLRSGDDENDPAFSITSDGSIMVQKGEIAGLLISEGAIRSNNSITVDFVNSTINGTGVYISEQGIAVGKGPANQYGIIMDTNGTVICGSLSVTGSTGRIYTSGLGLYVGSGGAHMEFGSHRIVDINTYGSIGIYTDHSARILGGAGSSGGSDSFSIGLSSTVGGSNLDTSSPYISITSSGGKLIGNWDVGGDDLAAIQHTVEGLETRLQQVFAYLNIEYPPIT